MLMPIAPILKDPLIASVLRDTPEMVSRVWVSGDYLLLWYEGEPNLSVEEQNQHFPSS